jgi:hypothetical protein
VLAFDDALITFTLAVSSLLAGWAAEYVSVRVVMAGLAAVELLFAIVWTAATRRVARLPVGPLGAEADPRAEEEPGEGPPPAGPGSERER